MEVKEAIKIAKAHVAELFEEEGANHILLEEAEFDEAKGEWRITVAFHRKKSVSDPFQKLNVDVSERIFRAVSIEDATGRVKSVLDAAA